MLTPAQEAEIVAWCGEMQRHFLPVWLAHLRDYATAILQQQAGPDNIVYVGENWVDRFHVRHPEIQVVTNDTIDERRAQAKNPISIMDYYIGVCDSYRHIMLSKKLTAMVALKHPSKILDPNWQLCQLQ